MATEGTVRTCAYPHEIRRHEPSATVHQVGCPRFVPLVEAGTADSAEAADAAREYLRPLLDAGCERIILGCTHYPFLLPVLQRVAADEGHTTIEFIDPADEISAAVRAAAPYSQAPDRRAVLSSSYHGADTLAMRTGAASLLLTTGPADTLERQVPVFVPAGMCRGFRIAHARWTDGKIAPCTAL